MTDNLPPALEKLVHQLSRLPSIGRKSALRLAFHLLKQQAGQARELADAVAELHQRVHFCRRCFYLAEEELCSICRNPNRDQSRICVVEEPSDVAVFERSGAFNGLYHVLLGRLSPLQGVMPQDLKIDELVERVAAEGSAVTEVVLAMNPSVDGDATALYIARLLEPHGVGTSRLGLGLPMGGSLEYADEMTVQKAFEGRRNY